MVSGGRASARPDGACGVEPFGVADRQVLPYVSHMTSHRPHPHHGHPVSQSPRVPGRILTVSAWAGLPAPPGCGRGTTVAGRLIVRVWPPGWRPADGHAPTAPRAV